jgi:hypothetical protein
MSGYPDFKALAAAESCEQLAPDVAVKWLAQW